ncbi:hypothetical protein BDZ97DRAFT_1090029 [Flammula alnicola]|nr:hypothetical protein BDZ97DRAFT_1090029 [Flammula alnicola]
MPSFAHDDAATPLLSDKRKDREFSYIFMRISLPFLQDFADMFGTPTNIDAARAEVSRGQPVAWRKTLRPHPLSTPCSRFLDNIPEWTATDLNTNATAVFEARCEISSGDIHRPIDMGLSSDGNILAISSMGGWKDRIPYIFYYLPNHEEDPYGEFMKQHSITVDLASTIETMILDNERRLVIAADCYRIKSYRCNEPGIPRKEKGGRAMQVHTMDSKGYEGPLAMLLNGRVARAGDGKIGIWDLDSLQTHGDAGKDIIGSKMDEDDIVTWRDDPEDIEPSTGSPVSTTITLQEDQDGTNGGGDSGFVIAKWHRHPSQANIMLSATDKSSGKYHCHALDLEARGKVVSRYLGHGGSVDGFSTSPADPNVFLTWCSDGFARLYDIRQVLPVITMASAKIPDDLPAAVLAHSDGIPFIFTGTRESEHIKLWDVRARGLVYALATGNNSVTAMQWDAGTNSLYAATTCPYIGGTGQHIGYRQARIPKMRRERESDDQQDRDKESMDDDDDDDEDEIEEESEDICWPERAYHAENHFGHVFDAGDHRLYKFSFKMDPSLDMQPYYGSGSLSRGSLW